MSIPSELSGVKAKILEHVKDAAQESDVEAISRWSRAAEQWEGFIKEAAELDSRIRDFIKSLWPKSGVLATASNIGAAKKGESPKRQGAEIRDRWVSSLASKGIQLTGYGKRYRTQLGKSLSVASANELDRPQLKNKWFLGLKDEPTDVAALLCRDTSEKLYDFVIPVSDLGTSWEALSRSGEQIKFNIQRESDRFLLKVPAGGPIEITGYLSNYRPLDGLGG